MKCPLTTRSGERRLLEFSAGWRRGKPAGELRDHVSDCAACSEWMRSQRAVLDLLDVWEPAPPSQFFDNRLRSRLASEPRHAWWGGAFSLPLAATAVMVLAALLVNAPSSRPTAQPPRVVQLVDVQQIDQAFEDLQLLHQLDPSQDEE